ncbi:penicillin-binding protein [Paenibacillus sp. WQ 127069]|uniref:Penicillin-binding protein n=1 Tax=Paenibacillus baimaensis TaxID=2982185 RepID=A0ABT2UKQ6_9BACL|nr:transglycosylase domain-containing protein [Paenibacillus sp. WQ 127069]MCU6795228.1 penicillin-binding protein [Paenibacillus sp. WQ 127069]
MEMEMEKKKSTAWHVIWSIVKYTLITFKWILIICVIAGFLGGGVAFGYVSALVKEEPIRSKESMTAQVQENALSGFVYFNDGSIIGQLRGEEDRLMAKLEDIPPQVIDAVFAIEDKNFYEHNGIDFKGTARAIYQKLMKQDIQTGGSTITQQLARRVFLTLDREDSRKAKEIFLAMRMERLMSKDEILLAYLNKIPYGNGSSGYNAYGIKAAAKGIFNITDLKELNIAQAAYLAGVPQLPSNYSAFSSKGQFDGAAFKRATTRQQLVLRRMLEENKINQQQYQEALDFDLQGSLAEPVKKAYSTYPYLMIEMEKAAAKAILSVQDPKLSAQPNSDAYNEALRNTQSQLGRAGYKIYTTLDKDIYESMRDIAENPDNFTPEDPVKGIEQIGAVMMDSKSGAILGMMEGRDFFTEQMNHATQAYRQPGSAMKPIAAFIPAMEKGAIQPGSIIDDVPILLKDRGSYHIPENWDNQFHGLITARRAFNQSYNIPAIKIFLDIVGIENAWDLAKKMGITSIAKEDYSAQTGVIGGMRNGVSVKELTNAYNTISNKGVHNEAFMIQQITDSTGKVIYEHEAKPTPLFSEQTAYLMTDMMRTVVTAGTATDLMSKFKQYGKIAIVGKTGSTQDDADAWFMGYTPDITLGVWAGYDSPVHKLSSRTGGTSRAKNIWALVMNEAINKKPEYFPTKTFKRPENIVEMTVSGYSGKLPSAASSKSGKLVTDLFNRKYIPTVEDNVFINLSIIPFNGINYIAQESTPAEFVTEKTVIKREKSVSGILKQIQEIMQKVSPDRRRSIDHYRPIDYEDDAPTENDPRVDDGKPPVSPITVVATRAGDTSVITFQASSSPDTVGYRLYRSLNRGPFERLGGKITFAGEETKFTDQAAGNGVFGYYVTAVDVGGQESAPSKASFTDGSIVDPLSLIPDVSGAILPPPLTGSPTGATSTGGNTATGSGTATPGTGNGSNNGAGKPGTGTDGAANPGTGTNNNGTNNGAAPGTANQGDSLFSPGPPLAVPETPSGMSIKAVEAGLVISWKANAAKDKVKQYTIFYSDKETGAYSKLGTISSGTEFRYYAAVYDGFYKIAATNDLGESKQSAAVRFKK